MKKEISNYLDDFCEFECEIVCKKKDKMSKEKCMIKKFVDYMFYKMEGE